MTKGERSTSLCYHKVLKTFFFLSFLLCYTIIQLREQRLFRYCDTLRMVVIPFIHMSWCLETFCEEAPENIMWKNTCSKQNKQNCQSMFLFEKSYLIRFLLLC